MRYWNLVLGEVLNRNNANNHFIFIHRKEEKNKQCKNNTGISRRMKMKTYAVGDKYPGIHFTRRESECMLSLIKGRTIAKTAELLKLSPRTVEFYLNNMKKKTDCHSKSELIEKVMDSDFRKNIDFDV